MYSKDYLVQGSTHEQNWTVTIDDINELVDTETLEGKEGCIVPNAVGIGDTLLRILVLAVYFWVISITFCNDSKLLHRNRFLHQSLKDLENWATHEWQIIFSDNPEIL